MIFVINFTLKSLGAGKILLSVDIQQKTNNFKSTFKSKTNFEIFRLGSALKFCSIAEGRNHYYPKFGNCSEWDTAAGVCILEGAGGKVVDFQNQPLRYNTREDNLSSTFVASA